MIKKLLPLIFITFSLHAQHEPQDDLLSLDSLLNLKINSASRYQQTSAQAPSSVSIITSEEILLFGYSTLDEVLNSVRGFYTSNDRIYSYLGNRGFSRPTDYNNRTLLLLNGNYLNEPVFGSSPTGTDFNIPLEIIERIEVVRGPGSAVYGSNAMLAVINIVTKNSELLDRGSFTASGDSRNTLSGSFYYGKRVSSEFNFFTGARYFYEPGEDLYYREYEAPETNFGIVKNLDFDKSGSFYLGAGISDLRINMIYTDRSKGVPTGAFEVNYNEMSYTIDRKLMMAAAYEKELSSSLSLSANFKFDYYYYFGAYPYTSVLQEEAKGTWLTPSAQLVYDLASNNRLIAGVEYLNILNVDYIADLTTQENKFNDKPAGVVSFFVQDDYQVFSDFSILAGLRYDYSTDKKDFFSPRFSIIYNAGSESTIKFIYGRAFRAPSMYEMQYYDLQTNFIKNPDLISEDISSAELVYEQKLSEMLFGSVSVYYNQINNLIDTKEDPVTGTLQFNNSSKVTASGAEAELTGRLGNNFSFRLNYSYQFASLDETGEWLTNSPIHILKAGITLPVSDIGQLSLEFLFDSKRKSVRNTLGEDAGVLSATFTSEQFWKYFRFAVKANNLLDAKYSYPGGFEHLQNFIEQNRRVIRFSLITEF